MRRCNKCDKEFDEYNIQYEEVYYGICPFCHQKLEQSNLVEPFDSSKVIIFPNGTKFYDYYRLYDYDQRDEE